MIADLICNIATCNAQDGWFQPDLIFWYFNEKKLKDALPYVQMW